jgi:division protein CdvB (Snf7/Vps24/ESCRT-III family)
MVDDAMDMLDDDADEDAADEEVERVMTEIAADTMHSARAAPTKQVAEAKAVEEDEEDEEDMSAMRERLAQLKG